MYTFPRVSLLHNNSLCLIISLKVSFSPETTSHQDPLGWSMFQPAVGDMVVYMQKQTTDQSADYSGAKTPAFGKRRDTASSINTAPTRGRGQSVIMTVYDINHFREHKTRTTHIETIATLPPPPHHHVPNKGYHLVHFISLSHKILEP